MLNLVQLVLTVCAMAGKPCKEVSHFYDDVTVLQCQMGSWRAASQWALAHEGYFVRKVRCQEPGREARL